MSLQTNHGTGTKARGKKPGRNLRAVLSVEEGSIAVPIPEPIPTPDLGGGTAVSTIQVGYPTPTTLLCANPFQAMGTAAATTQMAQTAIIYTPNGILVGTLDINPPPPFTWSYTFTDPLPTGVPLALLVQGTTGTGAADQCVVPFQAQGQSAVLNGQ
jgi:hypothetical protein